MRIEITKLSDNHNPPIPQGFTLKGTLYQIPKGEDKIELKTLEEFTVDRSVLVIPDKGFQWLATTRVSSFHEEGNKIIFQTKNSVYQIEKIQEKH